MRRWKRWVLAVALVAGASLIAVASDDGLGPELHVVAGGEIVFVRPPDFGLAVHPDQVLVQSYIPACDWTFDYCLYYLGQGLSDTNFESAGIRLERRDDLEEREACMLEPPRGYLFLEPSVREGDGYAVSEFQVGDAAAGHYAQGTVLRLSLEAACWELETRIAASRFENWPEGAIAEFTAEARAAVESRLRAVLRGVRLADRPEVELFPPP